MIVLVMIASPSPVDVPRMIVSPAYIVSRRIVFLIVLSILLIFRPFSCGGGWCPAA